MNRKNTEAIILTTILPCYFYYSLRFQIEFNFHDAKQSILLSKFGVGIVLNSEITILQSLQSS